MIDSGEVESFQQLAELGRISQPRMTQIMSLLHLAPDIQEELLHLPEVIQGKAAIHERLLRPSPVSFPKSNLAILRRRRNCCH